MSDLNLSVMIKAVDRITGPVKRISSSIRKSFSSIGSQMKKLGTSLNSVGAESKKLGLRMLATTGAVAYGFKRLFIDTAAQFEKFQTILVTTEGSNAAAKKAMDWISDFATKTPFELSQVTDAFVKLRAYGLDPTNGLLTTLGDTSSAMGKDIIQAVEAIADAVTGEYERLKEFGVKAQTNGNRTRFSYTDKSGTQKGVVVNKNDREAIEGALAEIFNEKFSGSMERLSKTWTGLISNISDQWTRFVNMVMENGVFDWLKDQLTSVLDKLNELASNGQLESIAKTFGQNILSTLKSIYTLVNEDLWPLLKTLGNGVKWLHDLFGSWKPVLIGVAAIIAGPLLLSLTSVATALASLGLALWTNPLVLAITAAVTAIGGAVYLIYKNWEPIESFFTDLWKKVTSIFRTYINGLVSIFKNSPLGLMIKGVGELRDIYKELNATESIKNLANDSSQYIYDKTLKGTETADVLGRSIAKALAMFGNDNARAALNAEKKSRLQIEVTDKRVQVKSISSDDMDINVDTGLTVGNL